MNARILKYWVLGLILIASSEVVIAGSIKGPIPGKLSLGHYLFILMLVVAAGIIAYYLYKRKKGDKTGKDRASGVIALDYNFDELTVKEREERLMKFLNDDNRTIRSYAAIDLVEKFEKLTTDFREEQILKLSKNEYSGVRAEIACRLSTALFDIISEKTRNKLIENLAADKDELVRANIVDAIRRNADKLPERLQNLLLVFAGDSEPAVRLRVSDAVHTNFNSIPENLREKLIKKLIKDEDAGVRNDVILAVKKYRKKLPEKLVNEILDDIEILQ